MRILLNILLFSLLLLFSGSIFAQKYAIYFTDKNNSPYSIDEPLEYLSQRALDRRLRYDIGITEQDLPVNSQYVQELRALGAEVPFTSKWLNCALASCSQSIIQQIENLEFVDKVVYISPDSYTEKSDDNFVSKFSNKFDLLYDEIIDEIYDIDNNYNYGHGYGQINQINGIPVHEQGYTGEGVIIAVLDSGFENVDKVDGFLHLFENNKIVFTQDIVDPGRNIFESGIHYHGTLVLSCMAGYVEHTYVGTAPQASYALIRTEDATSEFLIEEYTWLIGAETADSLGADIINSSLGYSVFDDPLMNHIYSEMDGKTAVSSIAAKMARERGVFVTVSAGNSNGTSWPWVGTPADTPQALTLGAVDLNDTIANFSSIGPNGNGDPKPNVVACGSGAALITQNNTYINGRGTSFSSPITCGMVACIIQAFPNIHPWKILETIERSSNRYPNHDDAYGYGIPDFAKVLEDLGYISVENISVSNLSAYPNPVTNKLCLKNDSKTIKSIHISDISGRPINDVIVNDNYIETSTKDITKGLFFVKVIYTDFTIEIIKIIKE